MIMDNWMQCLTMIVSFSGLVFFLNKNHREDMNKMDTNHREDLKKIDDKTDKMDAKWDKLFNLFVELKLKNEK